jgi:ribose 5-phosphate isomerase B
MKKDKIAIGSDHGGFDLKKMLVPYLKSKNLDVVDVGTFSEAPVDYPDTSYKVARMVSRNAVPRGILICKSGIGDSIVANKAKGVRAALCYNIKAARLSRMHNDANILVIGSLFVNPDRAKKMVDVWLKTSFEGGRHLRRLKKIERIEGLCACR